MLLLNTGTGPHRPLAPGSCTGAEATHTIWIDLVRPTEAERQAVERATGLRVPSQAELSEVESSSRLSVEGDTVYLSTPMSYRSADGMPMAAPLGFVLSPRHLLTVRFVDSPVFDLFAGRFAHAVGQEPSSGAAFVGLLEAIVDGLADVLEWVGGELDALSRRVFRPKKGKRRNAARTNVELRVMLRRVGRAGDLLSNIRGSLLGVNRIALNVPDAADGWFPHELRPRFKTLRQDLASLADYDAQLTNKVQFLLDATLGFINIEQSNGIRVLTVVSVVGVPPTLVASVYGMNFQHMPELGWSYGYLYGLGMIVFSGVLPLLWFKRRGWV